MTINYIYRLLSHTRFSYPHKLLCITNANLIEKEEEICLIHICIVFAVSMLGKWYGSHVTMARFIQGKSRGLHRGTFGFNLLEDWEDSVMDMDMDMDMADLDLAFQSHLLQLVDLP
jgi:hypothetical protein